MFGMMGAAPAVAQSQSASQADQDQSGASSGREPESQLEEIVVTARYAAENLQDTPLAVTAVSGAALEARAIEDVATLSAVVPNLYTHPGSSVQGPTPTISMRGVTAGDYSFARDPAVGIYVDDVYHSTLVGANLDLSDIDHIEVRRGPQGTLSGYASIAGTISIYSKPPSGDGSGHASVAYGSFNEVELKGSFDTTIAPDLFVRVSGQAKRQSGYVDRLDFTCQMREQGTPELAGSFPLRDRSANQRGCKIGTLGGTQSVAGKVMLRYLASDRLELNATASYYKEDNEAAPEVLLDAHPSKTDGFGSVYSQRLFDRYGIVYDNRFRPPAGRPYTAYTTFDRPLEGIGFENSQGQFSKDASLKADYDLADDIHLVAIGAFSHNGGHLHQPGDVSPLGYVQGQVFFDTKQWTGEVRMNGSALNDKFDWAAGVFYLNSKNHLTGDIEFITLNFTEDDHFKTETMSGFVHGDYHLTDSLSISGGVRWTRNSKSASLDHPPIFNVTIPFSVEASRFDWLASVNYNFTDDIMGYATVSTGSRPAGITTIVNTIYQLSGYPAEKLISYEAGLKTEFFDRRLRVNLAGFYSDYPTRLTSQAGFQCLGEAPPPTRVLLASECPPGGAIGWAITIGTPAEIKGVEFEVTAEPIDGMLINLSGGYNHFVNGVTTPGQPGYLKPGNLPQPELNMSGGIQYKLPLLGGELTPRLDWNYISKQTFTQSPSALSPGPFDVIPAHSVFNAQVRYDFPNDDWSATLAVTNLADKYYYISLFSGATVSTAGFVAPPREWRLTLARDF
jgi:iron complex outermembrane receptor protein